MQQFTLSSEGSSLAVLAERARIPNHGELSVYEFSPNSIFLRNRAEVHDVPEYSQPMLRFSADGKQLGLLNALDHFNLTLAIHDSQNLATISCSQALAGFRNFTFDGQGRVIATAESGLMGLDYSLAIKRHWISGQQYGSNQGCKKNPILQLVGDDIAYLGMRSASCPSAQAPQVTNLKISYYCVKGHTHWNDCD